MQGDEASLFALFVQDFHRTAWVQFTRLCVDVPYMLLGVVVLLSGWRTAFFVRALVQSAASTYSLEYSFNNFAIIRIFCVCTEVDVDGNGTTVPAQPGHVRQLILQVPSSLHFNLDVIGLCPCCGLAILEITAGYPVCGHAGGVGRHCLQVELFASPVRSCSGVWVCLQILHVFVCGPQGLFLLLNGKVGCPLCGPQRGGAPVCTVAPGESLLPTQWLHNPLCQQDVPFIFMGLLCLVVPWRAVLFLRHLHHQLVVCCLLFLLCSTMLCSTLPLCSALLRSALCSAVCSARLCSALCL